MDDTDFLIHDVASDAMSQSDEECPSPPAKRIRLSTPSTEDLFSTASESPLMIGRQLDPDVTIVFVSRTYEEFRIHSRELKTDSALIEDMLDIPCPSPKQEIEIYLEQSNKAIVRLLAALREGDLRFPESNAHPLLLWEIYGLAGFLQCSEAESALYNRLLDQRSRRDPWGEFIWAAKFDDPRLTKTAISYMSDKTFLPLAWLDFLDYEDFGMLPSGWISELISLRLSIPSKIGEDVAPGSTSGSDRWWPIVAQRFTGSAVTLSPEKLRGKQDRHDILVTKRISKGMKAYRPRYRKDLE